MKAIVCDDNGIFILPDGRKLSYSVYGNPDGKPVLFFHGIPGTRLQRSPDLRIFHKYPFLVYALDRPGYGNSTYQKNRNLLNWADDVLAFTESQGIGKFGVMGVSGGGPYSLACAYKIPEKLSAAIVISGLAPLYLKETFHQFPKGGQLLFRSAKITPFLIRGLFSILFRQLHLPLDTAFQNFLGQLPEKDKRLLSNIKISTMLRNDVAEAFKAGANGVVKDMSLLNQPWGFSLKDIEIPVHVWHGTADTIVPYSHGEFFINHLPKAIPHTVEDAGHFMAFERMEEILKGFNTN